MVPCAPVLARGDQVLVSQPADHDLNAIVVFIAALLHLSPLKNASVSFSAAIFSPLLSSKMQLGKP